MKTYVAYSVLQAMAFLIIQSPTASAASQDEKLSIEVNGSAVTTTTNQSNDGAGAGGLKKTDSTALSFGPKVIYSGDSAGGAATSMGADIQMRRQMIQLDPKKPLQLIYKQGGGIGAYYTSNNLGDGNSLVPSQPHTGTVDIQMRGEIAMIPRALFGSNGCGLFFAPGFQGETRVAFRGNSPNDNLRAAVSASAGLACVGDKDLSVLIGPIAKGSLGGSTYGKTLGTSAGGRIAIESKKVFANIEGTGTTTGVEDGGKELRLSIGLGFRPLPGSEIGVQFSQAFISDRDTKTLRDGPNSVVGPSVTATEGLIRATVAW